MADIDFELLRKQLEEVIIYSQEDLPSDIKIDCGEIIGEWWENKKKYFDFLLQGNLIWESPKPISIPCSPKIQERIFEQFIDSAIDFLIENNHTSKDIKRFTSWIRNNHESFFSNIVTNIDGFEDTEIKLGMKLIRAFKYFCEFDSNEIRHLQDAASQAIQKTKLEGILCFSIHPLDYMTISENMMNWRSCHALDGEYRSGNLSYMVDPSTIVCYIKSNTDTQLDRFPKGMLWNNKKWRVLLHFQKDFNIVYVNRQYPFSSSEIIKEVQNANPMWYVGFGSFSYYFPNNGIKEINGTILSQNYFLYKNYIINPADTCCGDEQSLQYNDFIYSPYYTPQFIKSNRKTVLTVDSESVTKSIKTIIGRRVKCPCCHKEYLTDSDSFICDSCKDQIRGVVGYCEECSSPIMNCDRVYGYVEEDPSRVFCESCLRAIQRRNEANGIVEAYCR